MESGDDSINRELPLFPSAPRTCSVPTVGSGSGLGGSPQQNHQPLTIFYDGRICVSDVTELQARAIITAAMREMEDRKRIRSRRPAAAVPVPSIANEYSRLRGPPSGVSMKRSLHRFLQERKSRVAAAMALHGHAPLQVQPLSPRFNSGQLSQTRRDVLNKIQCRTIYAAGPRP